MAKPEDTLVIETTKGRVTDGMEHVDKINHVTGIKSFRQRAPARS